MYYLAFNCNFFLQFCNSIILLVWHYCTILYNIELIFSLSVSHSVFHLCLFSLILFLSLLQSSVLSPHSLSHISLSCSMLAIEAGLDSKWSRHGERHGHSVVRWAWSLSRSKLATVAGLDSEWSRHGGDWRGHGMASGFQWGLVGFGFRWGCLIFCYVFLSFGFKWFGFWIPMGWVLDFDGVWVGFELVRLVGLACWWHGGQWIVWLFLLWVCWVFCGYLVGFFFGFLVLVGFWWAVGSGGVGGTAVVRWYWRWWLGCLVFFSNGFVGFRVGFFFFFFI